MATKDCIQPEKPVADTSEVDSVGTVSTTKKGTRKPASTKANQSRGWILTLPASEYGQEAIVKGLGMYQGVVGQLEQGTDTEYKHWQVYVEHASPIKFATLRNKFPKAHFEPRRGSKRQAYEYVTKQDTRVTGKDACHIETGSIDLKDSQGKRNDLAVYHEAIMEQGLSAQEVMREHPGAYRYASNLEALQNARDQQRFSTQMRDVEVTYIYGAPGVGKTRYVYDKFEAGTVYRVSDYTHPFDNYAGQNVLVLDEFDSQIGFDLLMNVLDRYPLELPARYRNRWAGYTNVVIISNLPLGEQYKDMYWTQRVRWQALKRRIGKVYKMRPGGTLRPDIGTKDTKPTSTTQDISDEDFESLLPTRNQ